MSKTVYIVWMTPVREELIRKELESKKEKLPPRLNKMFSEDLRDRGWTIGELKREEMNEWIRKKIEGDQIPSELRQYYSGEFPPTEYLFLHRRNPEEGPLAGILVLIRESDNPSDIFYFMELMRHISREEISSSSGIILGSYDEKNLVKEILLKLYKEDSRGEEFEIGSFEENILEKFKKGEIKIFNIKIFNAAGYFAFLCESLDETTLDLLLSALLVCHACSSMLDNISRILKYESEKIDPRTTKESLERLSRLWDIFYDLHINPPLEHGPLSLFDEIYNRTGTKKKEKFVRKKYEALQASVTSLLNQKNMETLNETVDEMEKSSALSERTSKALNVVNFIISLLAVFELGQFLQEFHLPLALIASIMISVFIGLLVLIAKVPEYIISRSLPEIRKEIPIEEIGRKLEEIGGNLKEESPDPSFKLIFADLSGDFWRIRVERKRGIFGLGGSNAYNMFFIKDRKEIRLTHVVERISGRRKSPREKAVKEISAFLKNLGAKVEKGRGIILKEESIENFVSREDLRKKKPL